jgi:cyanate permease
LGAGSLTTTLLVARWFVAQRGRAMGLLATGYSLGAMALTPLVGWLIEKFGWRGALLAMAAIVTAPLLAIGAFVRERPGPGDVEPAPKAKGASRAASAAEAASEPMSVGAILSSANFWFIGLAIALTLSVIQGLMVSYVPIARESGLTAMQAAKLISIFGVAAIAAALLVSVLAGIVDAVLLLAGFVFLGALLNAALLASDSHGMLVACAAIMGLVAGATTPLSYAVLADRFGAPSFGTVRGLTLPLICGGGIVAVRFAGEVYDRTGQYHLAFVVFAIVQLVATALVFATRLSPRTAVPAAAAGR